jgi:hypothetical protein
MIRVDVGSPEGPEAYSIIKVPAINQDMVDLRTRFVVRVLPSVFPNIPACEVGFTDCHPSGCGEVDQSEAAFISY